MAIDSKFIIKFLQVALACFILGVGVIFFTLIYEKKEDVSDIKPYSEYLNIPFKLDDYATIQWSDTKIRFSHYSLNLNEASDYDREDIKSVKVYKPGETVTFHKAKKFSHLHTGTTYYLIGRDTIDTGEVIEFEFHYSSGLSPFSIN